MYTNKCKTEYDYSSNGRCSRYISNVPNYIVIAINATYRRYLGSQFLESIYDGGVGIADISARAAS